MSAHRAEPWPHNEHERQALIELVRSLIGRRLDKVSYIAPSTSNRPERREYRGFDEVDMGVELVTTEGDVFVARWQMMGGLEGLAFEMAGREVQFQREKALKAADVTGADPWRQRGGHLIESVGLAWHIPDEGCPSTTWAIRLMFDSAEPVVIALGEAGDETRPAYQPDSVVVIFDEELARGYEIPASWEPAWGGLV